MKLFSRIILAALAIGIFQLGAQAKNSASANYNGGGTGDVIIISG